jgi:molybdopterin/thiamine biosynthesis adenylyltransferase
VNDFRDLSRAGLFAEEALGRTPAVERQAQLRSQPLLIAMAPGLGMRGQLMLATLVNIVGRLFDYVGPVDLDVPDERAEGGIFGFPFGMRLPWATARFLRELRPVPREADVELAPKRGPYQRAIVIGGARRDDVAEPIYIDGAGWVAAVSPEPELLLAQQPGAFNPFGGLVAPALGAAQLAKSFFRAVGGEAERDRFPRLEEPCIWDLWSHGSERISPGPGLRVGLDLGDVGIGGLGALGSAALLGLIHVEGATGCIELVDDDLLSSTNLERVLTAFGEDVGWRKTGLARRALGGTALRSRVIVGRYGRELPRQARASTILVGVDSGEARRQITRHLPEALYNGGTQGSEILVSRHVRFGGACLECLYPESVDPVGRTARKLGVDRATAAALEARERKLDAEVLAAMQRRGGVHFRDVAAESLLGEPLDALESYECSRAVVVDDLPEATIGFVAALCGFLMASEFVKDVVAEERPEPLDDARPAYRLDLLAATPHPNCVEAYVPRRDCFCQRRDVRGHIAALRGGAP